ncbi:MAG: hypothetical protein IJW28_01355, partial [Clostridia bacterium]|nr:hypothetical protein [Clostridia bacterium]
LSMVYSIKADDTFATTVTSDQLRSALMTVSLFSDWFELWSRIDGNNYSYPVLYFDSDYWEDMAESVNTNQDVIIITTPEQLSYIAYAVNYEEFYFEGKTVMLGNNISLSGRIWTPIGYADDIVGVRAFKGTFDFAGYRVTGITSVGMKPKEASATVKHHYSGLFGYTQGAVIKNAIIGSETDKDAYVLSSDNYIGALVAYAEDTEIIGNVENYITVIGGTDYIGGIVGYYKANRDITTDATFVNHGYLNNQEKLNPTDPKTSYEGGIFGYIETGSFTYTIESALYCYNEETIVNVDSYIAGIVGYVDGNFAITDFAHSCVDIDADGNYIAGIAGYVTGKLAINNVSNCGDIVARGAVGYVAGIVGYAGAIEFDVAKNDVCDCPCDACIDTDTGCDVNNSATISAINAAGFVSGIAGFVGDAQDSTLNTALNTGAIITSTTYAVDYVANIIGKIEGNLNVDISITNEYAGTLYGRNYVASLIGYVGGNITYSTGNGATLVNTPSSIIATGDYVAGMIGYIGGDMAISTANNLVQIESAGVDGYVGGIIGMSEGSVTADTLSNNATIVAAGGHVGGVIGSASKELKITTSITNNEIVTTTGVLGYVGGIAGYAGAISIEEVSNNANVVAMSVDNTSGYIAGLIGAVGNEKATTGVLKSAVNNGAVLTKDTDSPNYVAGLVGSVESSLYVDSTLINNYDGTLYGTDYVAGLIGYAGSNITYSTGTGAVLDSKSNISALGNYVAGLIGEIDGNLSVNTMTLAVDDALVEATGSVGYVAGLVGYAKSNINISNSALNVANVSSYGDYVGGLFGAVLGNIDASETLDISDYNLLNKGSVSALGNYVAGIVGYVNGSLSLDKSQNQGVVLAEGETGFVGGIAGYADSITVTTSVDSIGIITATNVINDVITANANASVKSQAIYADATLGKGFVGGLVGYIANTSSINNAVVTAVISTQSDAYAPNYVAGAIGRIDGDLNVTIGITYDRNGTINGGSYVGGIIGYIDGSIIGATDSYLINKATINTVGDYTAGIVGSINGTMTVSTATNTGANIKTSGSYVGGIVGNSNNDITITSVSNIANIGFGAVGSGDYLGGIIGRTTGIVTINDATNDGNITSSGNVGYVAGIIAYAEAININTAINNGDLNAHSISSDVGGYVAGVVAYANSGDVDNTLNVATNTGDIATSGSYVGGIVAKINSSLLSNDVNTYLNDSTSVVGKNYVAGVASYVEGRITVDTVINKASVKGTGEVGYVAGNIARANGIVINSATNNGSVEAMNIVNTIVDDVYTSGYVGGIAAFIGNFENTNSILNSAVNNGAIKTSTTAGPNFVAGIIANIDGGLQVDETLDNTYTGTIYVTDYVSCIIGEVVIKWKNYSKVRNFVTNPIGIIVILLCGFFFIEGFIYLESIYQKKQNKENECEDKIEDSK